MTEVELKYVELTPELLEEHLSKPEEVAMLDLSGNNISSEQCIALVKTYITNMPKLEALDLKDNKIGTEGAVELFQALQKYCPRLRYLDVNENGIQDDSLFDLATLVISCKYLTTLNVVTNHITMRGLPTLCDGLARSRSLTELSLAYNVLGDHGATTVAETLGRHCPTLLSLDLSDNRIGDEGAISVAEAFLLSSASRLESLNLSVNNIGDVGFKAIAEALTSGKNQRFKYLDLGCNASVGDAGRRTLTESASRMRSVHFIDFTSCNLSDDDATRLTVAILNPKSSLDGVEWFNNPRMTLPVEKCLFEAIETTKTRRSSSKNSRLFGVPPCMLVAAVGAAVLAVALTLRRTRQG